MASSCVTHLKERIRARAKPLQEKVTKMKTDNTVIQQITVEQAINGMRGINGMVTETSDLSAMDGIKYRGIPLKDACKVLPTANGGEAALPEGALWLLLTGEVPKADTVA